MLRQDLQKELGMGEKDVVVNQLTRQVIVKVRLLFLSCLLFWKADF